MSKMPAIEPPQHKLTQNVLLRDEFTCQTCGATAADVGGREHMRVGYVARNDPQVENLTLDLKTLCPDCDDGFATAGCCRA